MRHEISGFGFCKVFRRVRLSQVALLDATVKLLRLCALDALQR
jgi:hypothetical protein